MSNRGRRAKTVKRAWLAKEPQIILPFCRVTHPSSSLENATPDGIAKKSGIIILKAKELLIID